MNTRSKLSGAWLASQCFVMPRRRPATRSLSHNEASNQELVQRMRKQLNSNDSLQSQGKAWDSLWKAGSTPWDLGRATPVLLAELDRYWNNSRVNDQEKIGDARVFRSLVPGCGAGYDLVTLAHHHDRWLTPADIASDTNTPSPPQPPLRAIVVGLDIAEASLVEHAGPTVARALQDDAVTRTRVDLAHGDFFGEQSNSRKSDTGWNVLHSYGFLTDDSQRMEGYRAQDETFDFIFDYTFFCALPPALRGDWGARMASLLRPDTGRLLTVMFPILPAFDDVAATATTTDKDAGPPYPVTVDDYRMALEPHGVVMLDEYGGPRVSAATVSARTGKELVCWWGRRNPLNEGSTSKL